MITSEIIDAMVESGCSVEQLASVVKAALKTNEIKAEEKRKKDRERKKKSRMSRDVTRTPSDKKTKRKEPKEKIKNINNNIYNNNYYSLPFSGEPFEGQVINLDAESFNLWFQQYSYGDEGKFREVLAKRDDWYSVQPYKTQQGWLEQTTRWLARNKNKQDSNGFTKVGDAM